MKIKFLATGMSPDKYQINGEVLTAFIGNETLALDFSLLETGDEFQGVETELINPSQVVRTAYRDELGELHLTLCQAVGSGDWVESPWLDAAEFVSERSYVGEVKNGQTVFPDYSEPEEIND